MKFVAESKGLLEGLWAYALWKQPGLMVSLETVGNWDGVLG